jgi:hypothetical protein
LETIEDIDLTFWLAAASAGGAQAVSDPMPDEQVEPTPEGSWGGKKFGPFTGDLWDVQQGVRVLRHSGLGKRSKVPQDVRCMFGHERPEQDIGLLLFDRAVPGTAHFVEWETPRPITLRSFFVKLCHDRGKERSCSRFRLFAAALPAGELVKVFEIDPVVPYDTTPVPENVAKGRQGAGSLAIRVNVKPVTARRFRAEFVQGDDGTPLPRGPKVIELDGFDGFCPDLPVPE